MAELEKVIKGLERCTGEVDCDRETHHNYCPYWNNGCFEYLIRDALSLLKAQEPIKPKINIDTWVCGNCGTRVEHQSMIGPNAVLAETFKFCPECGKPVKLE